MRRFFASAALSFALLAGAAPALAGSWTGKASFYGRGQGARTASGRPVGGLTAAHRTLPFGTRLRVTNLRNGRAVVVRVNDRGPFIAGRVIDVSTPAADALGFRRAGIAMVRVDTVD